MNNIAFVFRTHPHSSSQGREGLDALLATSAFSEDISVFFIAEGVTQLVANQQTDGILSRDYAAAFKLMELYDIENVFVCRDSLLEQGINDQPLLLPVERLSKAEIADKLHHCAKLLSF